MVMTKKSFVLIALLISFTFLIVSCKKPEKPVKVDSNIYEIGKTVQLTNKSEIMVKDVLNSPEYKLQTSTEGVQSFPFVYLKKDKNGPRIIKIQKDGTTIDTLIDTVKSNTFSSAYIVESGGDLTKTIASYVLDTKTNSIKPKKSTDQFVFVSVQLKNQSRKTIFTKDLKAFIELPDKSQKIFDPILADTILSSPYPVEIKANETAMIRFIGVIPLNSKNIVINIEGKKFKWEVIETKPKP